MLSDYLDFLKKVAINNLDVLKFRLIKELPSAEATFVEIIEIIGERIYI